MQEYSLGDFYNTPCPNVDKRLLPELLVEADNSEELAFCKIALQQAIIFFLEPEQQELLKDFYWKNLSREEIAQKYGVAYSTVSRRLIKTTNELQKHMQFALKIYRNYYNDLGSSYLH